jgi:hypothetical protein
MHKTASILLALTTAVGLTGCGLASRIDARRNYEASTAAYRACVTTNPPQACEGKRLAIRNIGFSPGTFVQGLGLDDLCSFRG